MESEKESSVIVEFPTVPFSDLEQAQSAIGELFPERKGPALENVLAAMERCGDPDTALNGLVVIRSWKMIGFTFIIFLSGVQSIPSSLREAARVDGAGFFGEVRHVILPLLRPYLLAGGIWIIINSLKVFDLAHMVTQGGPGVATLTLYLYCWKAAFQRYDMGLASRVAYVTAFVILFLSGMLNKLLSPESVERF